MNKRKFALFLVCFVAVFLITFIILNLFVFRVKLSFRIDPMYFISASLEKMMPLKLLISSAAGLIAGFIGLKIEKTT